jgi:NAD(P)-dependent dehydrogenase (short-subunit alcohol dehydrogenase family)
LTATAQKLGNQTLWLRADISKSQEIDLALEKIAEKFPTVDVLVNAAGFMRTIQLSAFGVLVAALSTLVPLDRLRVEVKAEGLPTRRRRQA